MDSVIFIGENEVVEYDIIYSSRRTLSLCIKDGKLVVRAPYGATREKIDEALAGHEKWIQDHLQRQNNKRERFERLSESDIEQLKAVAREILPKKVAYFAERMGIKYGRITVTSAKTRFGSCSSEGDLSFSYRLMTYPNEAIDYVVVHELAHIKEMNHSPRFYAVIEEQLPDYKERKKLLKY